MDKLSQLPPPPVGQKGISPANLSSLPPPPKTGGGMTLQQVLAQTHPTPQGSVLPNIVKNTATDYANAVPNFLKATQSSTNKNPIIATGENALAGTASAIGTLFAPISETIKSISNRAIEQGGNSPVQQKIASNPIVGKVLDFFNNAGGALDKWSQAHPEASQNLVNAITVGGTALGGGEKGLDKPIGSIEGIIKGANDTVGKIIDTAKNIPETIKNVVKSSPDTLKSSIDAVNPDLTGKKLISGYKQVVTGNREITPSSIFREQGLTPDQQTTNLGTRLQNLNLGKDPIKNLETLGNALTNTETKLTAALKGDSEVNYNANKPELLSNLDNAKVQMPREFSGIRDSKTTFNNVIDFAKQQINKAEDSITGLRDARSSFDSQTQREYPSAFKEGKIDTKTPAGRAIKTAREMINEHLYNTAPNGSEIQKLIGREADIFRATDNIAPKASATHGQNITTKIKDAIKTHPYISGAVGLGADKILKSTTGIGI